MNKIVNWEYYSSLFDKIKENDFEKAEELAEKEICSVIGLIHWNDITEETFGFEVLKDTICKVMDRMADDQSRLEHIGLNSVSNDGYSESWGSDSAISVKAELQGYIKQCLSGTGLVRAY